MGFCSLESGLHAPAHFKGGNTKNVFFSLFFFPSGGGQRRGWRSVCVLNRCFRLELDYIIHLASVAKPTVCKTNHACQDPVRAGCSFRAQILLSLNQWE